MVTASSKKQNFSNIGYNLLSHTNEILKSALDKPILKCADGNSQFSPEQFRFFECRTKFVQRNTNETLKFALDKPAIKAYRSLLITNRLFPVTFPPFAALVLNARFRCLRVFQSNSGGCIGAIHKDCFSSPQHKAAHAPYYEC